MFDKRQRLIAILGSCTILLFGLLGCTPTPPDNFVSTGGPIGYHLYGITKGPDGNLWFTEPNINGDKIGKISPKNGKVTKYNLASNSVGSDGICAGPDGNVWFTDGNQIGKISPKNGKITEYSVPDGGASDITAGPNGNLWFTDGYTNQIGKSHQ